MNDDKLMVRDAESRASDFQTIDRLLDSVFEGRPWAPAVDIRESEAELTVYAALPGLSKEDVSLELKDNTLVLSGRMKPLGRTEDSWIRRELPRGEFYRAFGLPADVQASKTTASMRDGVLEVRLPKVEEAKPRKIAIE